MRQLTIITAITAAILINSCQKATIEPDRTDSNQERVAVAVTFPELPKTKSAVDTDAMERAVERICLVIYRMIDGEPHFDSFYDFGDEREGLVYVYPDRPADSYLFVAYANHPTLGMNTWAYDWTHFRNERLGSFQMQGQERKTITQLLTSASISIGLNRQVCKLSVKKISLRWKSEFLAQKDFRIRSVYLTDVEGTKRIIHDVPAEQAESWWNPNGYLSSIQDAMIYSEVDEVLDDRTSIRLDRTFYGYISPQQEFNTTSEWKEGGTRLVIEASYGARMMYYPIVINNQNVESLSNIHYVIEDIIITKVGAPSPYALYPEENPVTVSCFINEWVVVSHGSLEVN